MDKLTMAHDFAKIMLESALKGDWDLNLKDIAVDAFTLADAMQAEADKRKQSGLPDALIMANSPQLEFQPDWSQAPDWANWWAMDEDGECDWFDDAPFIKGFNNYWGGERSVLAPSFNYQGDWKQSLRKRP